MTTDLVVSDKSQVEQTTSQKITVITFAPVQGFIEKSRKLRDLYGASQILSYLSKQIIQAAQNEGLKVISPVSLGDSDLIQGMPNRVLMVGEIEKDVARNLLENALLVGWQKITDTCKHWVERNVPNISTHDWEMSWKRWRLHSWEVFLGQGQSIQVAMHDLETRKLQRAWTVANWNGESSSLSGHDAIAYPKMDREINVETKQNQQGLKSEIEAFYDALAKKLDQDPDSKKNDRAYINENERLSIPELIKRLITYEVIANKIHHELYTPSFREMLRKDAVTGETYWTGWFMGDGDEVGKKLKALSTLPNAEDAVTEFSTNLRRWGLNFQHEFEQEKRGRVVYAGGDDFLGVMYTDQKGVHLKGSDAIDWLIRLRDDWRGEDKYSEQLGIKLSVGFVWAGHSVPQRDVLQHCREAEKRAKNLGRDRVTIRIVFNNGQFVEWTTPWEYLSWLKNYRDRDGNTGQDANWSHVYSDLAQLKARNAIPSTNSIHQDSAIALALFKLYFGDENYAVLFSKRRDITNTEDPKALIQWIEGMIKVGWQLLAEKNDV